MITLSQLHAFVAVARHRHFTRAAAELQVAQSSVSYQVREVERQLRVDLIDIVGRRVHLTDAGERLFARATALLNDIEDVEREMRDYGAGVVGRLRLGATHTVGGYALPSVLAAFRMAHPHIELRLNVDNVRAVEQMLLDRTVDLGVVEWPVQSTDLTSQPLRHDALVLIAPPDHPLVERGLLHLQDLRDQTFVFREPGSGNRALVEELLGPITADIVVAMEFDQPEAVMRAVEAGMGLAFISQSIVGHQLTTGMIRALQLADVNLGHDFSVVSLRQRSASPAMIAFREFLIDAWVSTS
ncbi:MAG TPA: LysR family transcriptional regulator [Chloroflexota bacterium]|nr:LysR family transcriptional regulator [Chloroflexota bacterium]